MQEILEVLKETAIDSIKLLPFLFITYLIMEYIEHKTSNKVKQVIQKSGKFGPLLGGIVGIVPQCGFSVSATNLYSARVITLGTLISVYLTTSDEMLPILISETMPASTILTILGIKLVIGVLAGFIIDFVARKLHKEKEETKIIGIRHGEKMYETLLTNEECVHAIDMGNFYRVPCDKRDLNYDKYFVDGNQERTKLSEFNSNNTKLLTIEQVKEKLLQLDYIQNELKNWSKDNAITKGEKLFGTN